MLNDYLNRNNNCLNRNNDNLNRDSMENINMENNKMIVIRGEIILNGEGFLDGICY